MTLGTVMGSGLPSTHANPRGCWPGVEPALPKGLGQLLGALSCLGNTVSHAEIKALGSLGKLCRRRLGTLGCLIHPVGR